MVTSPPRARDRLHKQVGIVLFVAGVLGLLHELLADHRAAGSSPLDAMDEPRP